MKRFDLYSLQAATERSKEDAESARRRLTAFDEDAYKNKRLYYKECKTCYYIDGPIVAGQAFTRYQCSGCETEKWNSNTACPKLCDDCSDKFHACTRCGGDLENRSRKALEE